MNFIIKTTPDELKRARKWWQDLEMQWKFAYNEAVYGKGPTIEPPKDEELMLLLLQIDTLRFAGPLAFNPNMTTVLTNLSGLIPLYHVTYLSISNMKLDSLKPLVRFNKLKYLYVYENQLDSLEGIENLTGLTQLYAQNNNITDLSPVKKLTNLETLYVTNNAFDKINGLTLKHEDKLQKFYVLPNKNLRHREVIRIQNELGILCQKG